MTLDSLTAIIIIKMMTNFNVTKLKGGSLSGTYLYQNNETSFIRKTVSLTENREFGFYRWFSQAKKLQYLQKMFPEIFPKILNMGVKNDESFFDLEYVKDSVTGFNFLLKNPAQKKIQNFFNALISAMEKLHSYKIKSFASAIDLYIDQEVERALEFCKDEPKFADFLKHKTIIFNGQKIPSIIYRLKEFYALAHKNYRSPAECLTHGNLTLENILYVEKDQKIFFIDVYQENFIDNIYNEYSQILQSSSSKYEICNQDELRATVDGNKVELKIPKSHGMDYFDELFKNYLRLNLDISGQTMVKLYEVSQFTRMLPFKKTVAKEKMIYFYSLASYLFYQITK